MSESAFERERGRLLWLMDPERAEKADWAKTGGAKVDAAVSLAQQVFEGDNDFALEEEVSTTRARRFTLSLRGSNPIKLAIINFGCDAGIPLIWAEAVPGSHLILRDARRHHKPPRDLDEEWVRQAIAAIMGNIDKRENIL